MKLLVQTLGEYMLNDSFAGQEVQSYRPSVVTKTPFIAARVGTRLEIIEELSDEASDADLASAKSKEELEVAIAKLPRPKKVVKTTEK